MLDDMLEATSKMYLKSIEDYILLPSPMAKLIKKYNKKPTKQQLLKWKIEYKIREIRERIGEIIAGRKFDDFDDEI